MSESNRVEETHSIADNHSNELLHDVHDNNEININDNDINDNDSNNKQKDTQDISQSQESETDSTADIQKFDPTNLEEQPELKRTPSMLQRLQTRLSFFNPKLKSERQNLVKKFMFIYLLMFVAILGIFSIYWGSAYKRNDRLVNLKMLVVIEDEGFGDIEPVIGNALRQALENPIVKKSGGWDIKNITSFREEAEKFNNTIEEEVTRQIHHQLYWTSIYVSSNATGQYYDYVTNPDSKVNISNIITSIYETGRDFTNMNSYVTPAVQKAEKIFLREQSNFTTIFGNNDSFTLDEIKRLSTPLEFQFVDKRPYTDPVLIAPSQVGLIYIIILTFFQVNLFGEVHQQVAKLNLKISHYLLYRLAGSYFSYFVISLGYSLVTLAFQVDFTKAFGKSGFLVYWMFSYLTMISVGLVNEVMFMVLLILFPPLVGFWLLFWVLINISPTFAPIALVPQFFRFGYAMPIHNSYELTKVVFFDTYKGQMGRNIGILIVWIVIGTCGFVFMLKPFGQTMMKRQIAAKKVEAEIAAKVAKAQEIEFERRQSVASGANV